VLPGEDVGAMAKPSFLEATCKVWLCQTVPHQVVPN
jgi:hypothetical protein